MREILFRGKRIDNGEWVEGYYYKRKTGYYDNIGFHEEYKDCIIVSFSDGGITWVDVDSETICQYTGLTDKNGKKIWEGDIVKEDPCCEDDSEPFIHTIIYSERYKVFATDIQVCGFMEEPLSEYLSLERCEIIGNIFDKKGVEEDAQMP